MKRLFQEGYRPVSLKDNDPNTLEQVAKENGQSANIQIIERWLVIRTWLDLIAASDISEKQGIGYEQALKSRIDLLDQGSSQTLIAAGTIIAKYNINPSVKDLDGELLKIASENEKEIFKQNYLADTLTAAEIRLLAWIYKDLFNKEYKIPQK